MFSFFDVNYYLQSKVALLTADGHTDQNGKAYTVESLAQAFASMNLTPMDHYLRFGRGEGLNPNAYFNEKEYMQAKLKQVQSIDPKGGWTLDKVLKVFTDMGLTPVEHYLRYGAFETDADGNFLNPSNAFDANAYWSAKMLELQTNYPEQSYTLEAVLRAFAENGLTPVSHYLTSGAAEANAGGIALVQTVPASQRVTNDALRETIGDVVPGNYNKATPAPDGTGKAVAKPADVGGLANESVSPAPDVPAKNLPVPGDKNYVAPPAALEDKGSNPTVPPSTSKTGKATDYWAQVDTGDGSALLIGQDGKVAGWLPPGSVETDSGLTIPSVAAQPVNNGSFAASTVAEAAFFTDGKIETYTVSFGTGGTHEVQSIDFTGITLLDKQRIVFQSDGDIVVLNSTTQSYSDEDLAAYVASINPSGWTVEQDGAVLTYTATSSGDKDPISISYSEPKDEVQSVDFAGLKLADGESISIDGAVVYENLSGALQSGQDIAAALSFELVADWTLSYNAGDTTVTFTSDTPHTDMPPLVVIVGTAGAKAPVTEVEKGGPSVPTQMAVNEDVPGTDGILAGSSLRAMDVIYGFSPAEDFIATASAVSELVRGGELAGLNEAAFAAVAGTGNGKVGAEAAGLFTYNGSHYLFINDADAAFDAGKDIVIKLVGLSDADVAAMSSDIFV